ncbi:MAG: hypothetical protein ACE5NA_12185, partial [Nitrospiraceae bacterium]
DRPGDYKLGNGDKKRVSLPLHHEWSKSLKNNNIMVEYRIAEYPMRVSMLHENDHNSRPKGHVMG